MPLYFFACPRFEPMFCDTEHLSHCPPTIPHSFISRRFMETQNDFISAQPNPTPKPTPRPTRPVTRPRTTTSPPVKQQSLTTEPINLPVVIGGSVSGFVLLLIILLVVCCIFSRRKKEKSDEKARGKIKTFYVSMALCKTILTAFISIINYDSFALIPQYACLKYKITHFLAAL